MTKKTKRGWFSRLFGGSSKDEAPEVVEDSVKNDADSAPVSEEKAVSDAPSSQDTGAETAPEMITPEPDSFESSPETVDEAEQVLDKTLEEMSETESPRDLNAFANELTDAFMFDDPADDETDEEEESEDDLEALDDDTDEEIVEIEETQEEALTPEPVAEVLDEPAAIEPAIIESATETAVEPETKVEAEAKTEVDPEPETPAPSQETQEKPKKQGFFARLKKQLAKTSAGLTEGFADLFLGKKEIDDEILEELETRLLLADVGINATERMLESIREEVSRKALSNQDELFKALSHKMEEILTPVEEPLVIDDAKAPYIILMVGVNGVGKTTTIGKLAKKFQAEGKSVMLAAGDTFRAAAVEQLKIWGERNHIPVVSQKDGADPASVIFDAIESAKAKKVDILIADTAGRLHTDSGLMKELEKIHRVTKRLDETAPHEVMLVVDAGTGQNALNQARQFNEFVPLSGISFTKMDGTAKGGIIFAIADELKIPVRFIGVGEGIDDLRPFNAKEFVEALIQYKA